LRGDVGRGGVGGRNVRRCRPPGRLGSNGRLVVIIPRGRRGDVRLPGGCLDDRFG
jgi:hypothetical protein